MMCKGKKEQEKKKTHKPRRAKTKKTKKEKTQAGCNRMMCKDKKITIKKKTKHKKVAMSRCAKDGGVCRRQRACLLCELWRAQTTPVGMEMGFTQRYPPTHPPTHLSVKLSLLQQGEDGDLHGGHQGGEPEYCARLVPALRAVGTDRG